MKLSTNKIPKPVSVVFDWIKTVIDEYIKDNGGTVAASVSFYSFVSLIPLILVAVAVFGKILGSQEQSRALLSKYVNQAVPGESIASGIESAIHGIIVGSTPAGIIGFLLLLWSGSSVFMNLGLAMDIAWNVTDKRSYIKERLISVGVLISAGFLLFISFALTTFANILRGKEVFGHSLGNIPFVWQIGSYLVPPFLTIAMFILIYKVLPSVKVPLKAALVGGVAAGITWEILKIAFTYYLTHFATLGAVYGSFTTVIILILWIYYSSIITVLGAETSQVYAQKVLGFGPERH